MSARSSEVTLPQLLNGLSDRDISVSLAQLRRWTDVGLVPAPRCEGLGRGRGTISYYPTLAVAQIAFLVHSLRVHRNLDDAGWALWAFGFPVTPFVRALLMEEWRDALRKARATPDYLRRRDRRPELRKWLKKQSPAERSSMFRVLSIEEFPVVAEMLAKLQRGTLMESEYHDEDWEDLQAATIAELFPDQYRDLLSDSDLVPSVAAMRAGLARLARDAALPNALRTLRKTHDLPLCWVRNEAQALISSIAKELGRPDVLLPRDYFRHYFTARCVDPVQRAETEKIPCIMGWQWVPPSKLDVLLQSKNNSQSE